jgi:hypothetical protein
MSSIKLQPQSVSVGARLQLKALTLVTCFVLFFFAACVSAQQDPQYGSMAACNAMSLGAPSDGPNSNGILNGGALNGFVPFPSTNAWNTNIINAPVDPNSVALLSSLTSATTLHPDFGSGSSGGGIPYIVVDSSVTPSVPINLWNASEYGGNEDVVVAPYPDNVPLESLPANCAEWPQTVKSSDFHSLVLDRHTCWLYETWSTTSCDGAYQAESETIWDMVNYESRPWGWTSVFA